MQVALLLLLQRFHGWGIWLRGAGSRGPMGRVDINVVVVFAVYMQLHNNVQVGTGLMLLSLRIVIVLE